VLKQWYQRQGFIVTEIKRFPHLPFTVCLMEKTLRSRPQIKVSSYPAPRSNGVVPFTMKRFSGDV
jgi:hypothetical protein